jgi:hypothetical protein
MDEVTAPQRVVANPEYPYSERVLRAREQLAQMGIEDVKSLYEGGVRVANDTSLPGRRSRLNRLIRTTVDDRLAG